MKICWLGHAWNDWRLYWVNHVGGEVRERRECAACHRLQDRHVGFGRPSWVGRGRPAVNENRPLFGEGRRDRA